MIWIWVIGCALLVWFLGPKAKLRENNALFIKRLLAGPFSELHKLSPKQALAYIDKKESQFSDVVDDTHSVINWFDGEQKQNNVVVFVHGFSATHQEISPIPQEVAKSLHANLLMPRLHGHGRHAKYLKESRAEDWLEQMWETINLAACLGQNVILMGNSTGATLITWLVQQRALLNTLPCHIHSMVFISPNFEVNNKAVGLLTLPWAKYWINWFTPSHKISHPSNALQAKFWTSRYSTQSVYPLQVLLKWVGKSDLKSIKIPSMFIYNEFDPVVNALKTARIFNKLGSEIKKEEVWRIGQDHKSKHIIAGDIAAKENNEIVIESISNFLTPLLINPIGTIQSKKTSNRSNPSLKREVLKKYDVIILGGGINGVASAWELAKKGQKVLLLEKDDLAGKTSSNSSKLIHGGLRYLQQKEFKLVRNALKEREGLMELAPYLVRPLSFLIPQTNIKSFFMFRLGLWVYDHLYLKKYIKSTKRVNLSKWHGFQSKFKKALRYYDCQCDDARLVVELAKSCRELGVDIRPQMKVNSVNDQNNSGALWRCLIEDKLTHIKYHTTAPIIINACGPWADKVHGEFFHNTYPRPKQSLRLVRGSHLLVKQISKDAFLLPNEQDGRIVFVLPYQSFSIIGTTEIEQALDDPIEISKSEQAYLLNVVNQFVNCNIQEKDILHTYAGVRPLVEDEFSSDKALSREFKINVFADESNTKPILVNLLGGKITTFRLLANEVVKALAPYIAHHVPIQIDSLLGSNLSVNVLEKRLQQVTPFLDKQCVARLIRAYGHTCIDWFNAKEEAQLGEKFANGVYQVEIDYLIEQEWVYCEADLMDRRSRFSWQLSKDEITRLETYIQSRLMIYLDLAQDGFTQKIDTVGTDLSERKLFASQLDQTCHQFTRL